MDPKDERIADLEAEVFNLRRELDIEKAQKRAALKALGIET